MYVKYIYYISKSIILLHTCWTTWQFGILGFLLSALSLCISASPLYLSISPKPNLT